MSCGRQILASAVVSILAAGVVGACAEGCASFTADATNGDAGANRDATPAACPSTMVFSSTFDAPDPSTWTPMTQGAATIANTSGQLVASVTGSSADVALLYHRFALPPSTHLCITLRVRIQADVMAFNGGYVDVVRADLRSIPTDTGHAFVGLGVDKLGVFTAVQDQGGDAQLERPTIASGPPALSTVVYRYDAHDGYSTISVEVDGHGVGSSTLLGLPRIADITLGLGAATNATSGACGAVTSTLASVVVAAE